MSDDEEEIVDMLELIEKMEPEGAEFDRELGLDTFDPTVDTVYEI